MLIFDSSMRLSDATSSAFTYDRKRVKGRSDQIEEWPVDRHSGSE